MSAGNGTQGFMCSRQTRYYWPIAQHFLQVFNEDAHDQNLYIHLSHSIEDSVCCHLEQSDSDLEFGDYFFTDAGLVRTGGIEANTVRSLCLSPLS